MSVKNKVETICTEIFKNQGADISMIQYIDFIEDYDMDSLTFISLVVEIEDSLGIIFDDDDLRMENFGSVDSIVKMVVDRITKK